MTSITSLADASIFLHVGERAPAYTRPYGALSVNTHAKRATRWPPTHAAPEATKRGSFGDKLVGC